MLSTSISKRLSKCCPLTKCVPQVFPLDGNLLTHINLLPMHFPQWLTAFAQIVSRIGHPSTNIRTLLFAIMTNVLAAYPAQAVWSMVGIYHAGGGKSDRAMKCREIFAKFQVNSILRYYHQPSFLTTNRAPIDCTYARSYGSAYFSKYCYI
jgi:hypothetical protein